MNRSTGNVVDNKVVALEFQNEQFESNAKTSLNTIERLKQALNFKTSVKGLDEIDNAVNLNKMSMNSLTNSVGALQMSLDNVGRVAVFSMIADEAIKAKNAIEQLVKSLTVDQVSAGWDKYADKTSAIQTIMGATAKNFSSVEEQMEAVNTQMDKLNWFTDETSFKFLDMVNNIGKFTSNQVALNDAVTAMEGISTWAAKSGANVSEAGRAMYNLSQAIAVGSVKLMDWKSIENANMATAEFKETAIETAVALGTLKKNADGTFSTLKGGSVSVKNFNENLSDQWFSSEVLLETLNKYGAFTEKLHETIEKTNGEVSTFEMLNMIDAFKDGSIDWEEATKKTGLSISELRTELEALGSETMEFSRKAFEAAQETKTFQESIDYVKEAVSTGWMNTFEIIFGDYLNAKSLWSDFSEYLYEIFVKGGEERNEMLKDAFSATNVATREDWNKLQNAGLASDEYRANLRKRATEHGVTIANILDDEEWLNYALDHQMLTVNDLNDAFNHLGGTQIEFGEVNEDLKKKLEDSLENAPEDTQKLLDVISKYNGSDLEKIIFGDGSYTENAGELESTMDALLELLGEGQEGGNALKAVLAAMGYVSSDTSKDITEMSREELKQLGYRREQIDLIRKLAKEGKTSAEIMSELGIDTMSGADHWVSGLHNVMKTIISLMDVFKKQWSEIFPSIESDSLFGLLKGFDEGSASLLKFVNESEELRNVFSGVASVVNLVFANIRMIGEGVGMAAIMKAVSVVGGFAGTFLTAVGALAKGAIIFNILKGAIEGFGIDLGGVAGTVGSLVTKFAAWFKSVDPINKALAGIRDVSRSVTKALKDLGIKGLNSLGIFKEDIEGVAAKFVNLYHRIKENGFSHVLKAELIKAGVNISGIQTKFAELRKSITDVATSVQTKLAGGFGKIADFFVRIKENGIGHVLKAELTKAGINVSGLQTKFAAVRDSVLSVGTSIHDNFSAAFRSIRTRIAIFSKDGRTKINKFIGDVKKMGGLRLDNAAEVLGKLKTDVLDYFAKFKGFDTIKTAFKNVWGDITTQFGKFGINLDWVSKGFNIIGKAATTAFTQVKKIGGNAFKTVTAVGLSFGQSVSKVFPSIKEKGADLLSNVGSTIKDFVHNIGEQGGITFENVKAFASKLWENLTSFDLSDALSKVRDAFSTFWENVRTNAASLNINLDWLTNAFEGLGEFGGKAFNVIKVSAGKAIDWIHKLWDSFRNSTIVRNAVANFGDAFSTIWDKKGTFFEGLKKGFGDFFDDVSKNGITLEGIKSFGEQLWEQITSFEGFQKLGDAFQGLWEDMKLNLNDTFGIDVDAIKQGVVDVIQEIWDTISGFEWPESLNEVPKFLGDIVSSIQGFTLPESFTSLFGTVSNAAEEVDAITGAAPEIEPEKITMWDTVKMVFGKIFDLCKYIKDHLGQILAAVVGIVAIKKIFGVIEIIHDFAKAKVGELKSSNFLKIGLGIAAIAAAFWIIVAALTDIQNIPQEDLKRGVKAFRDIMIALGLLVAAASIKLKFKAVDYKTSSSTIWALAAFVAALGIVVDGLMLIPDKNGEKLNRIVNSIISIITALGVLMGVAEGSDLAGGWFGSKGVEFFSEAAQVITALTGLIAAIGIVLGALALLVDVDKIKMVADAITEITAVLSVLVLVAGISGVLGGGTALAAGLEGLKVAAISLGEIVGVIAIIAVALGELDRIPGLKLSESLQNGLDMLVSIGQAIGDFIGKLVGGVYHGVGEGIFGESSPLQSLADDIAYIVEVFGDPSFAENIKTLSEFEVTDTMSDNLKALTLAGVVESLAGVVSGLSSALSLSWAYDQTAAELVVSDVQNMVDTFANQDFKNNVNALGTFAISDTMSDNLKALNLAEFVTSINGFVSGVFSVLPKLLLGKTATEAVVNDINTIASTWGSEEFITGITNLGTFDVDQQILDNLSDFGDIAFVTSLTGFLDSIGTWVSNTLNGEDGANTNVERVVNDLKTISDTWGDPAFISSMEAIGTINVPKEQIDQLTEALNTISTSGDNGFFGAVKTFLSGSADANLSDFKTRAGTLGEAIAAFTNGLSGANVWKLSVAGEATQGLASIMTNILAIGESTTYSTEFSNALTGLAGSLEVFAERIEHTGDLIEVSNSVTGFITALSTLDSEFELSGDLLNDSKVNRFAANLDKIIEKIAGLNDLDTSGVTAFTSAVTTLANQQLSYSGEASVETKIDTSNVEKDAGKVSKSMGDAAENAEAAVSDKAGLFVTVGSELITALAQGVSDQQAVLNAAIGALISSARDSIDTSGFNTIGYWIVSGLAHGIASNQSLAIQAAVTMAVRAYEEAKKAIKVSSPSKLTYELGMFFDQGFANGITDFIPSVTSASESVAEASMEGLRSAVDMINSFVDTDINTDPVIRPVLDLTEIQNGAGNIGSLLTAMGPIDPFGNFGAIGNVVEARRSATSLDDVVSALGVVNRSASNIRGGDTYIVDGITYDDGSNITDAVRTLVRAARVGRRT